MPHSPYSDKLRALAHPQYPTGKLKALIQPGQTWEATIHNYDAYGVPVETTRVCQVVGPHPACFWLAHPDRLDDAPDWWTFQWPYDHQVHVAGDGTIQVSRGACLDFTLKPVKADAR